MVTENSNGILLKAEEEEEQQQEEREKSRKFVDSGSNKWNEVEEN